MREVHVAVVDHNAKLEYFGYFSSQTLASVNLTCLAPKATYRCA